MSSRILALLTPEIVARHVTERTRAIMPVHIYGQLCDVEGIRRAIDNHPRKSGQVRIIEDAAHCFEGEYRGNKPGRFGDVALFSFYATKNVTCGEGGALIAHDGDLFQRILEARLHGMSAAIAVDRYASNKYNHWDMNRLGTKANLPDILAALLPPQIETIDQRLPRRQEVAERYREAFGNSPAASSGRFPIPRVPSTSSPSARPQRPKRDDAIATLNAAGIHVAVNFRSVPGTHYYSQKYPQALGECPNAGLWGSQTLTLPMYPSLTREEQDYVIKVVCEQSLSPRKTPSLSRLTRYRADRRVHCGVGGSFLEQFRRAEWSQVEVTGRHRALVLRPAEQP